MKCRFVSPWNSIMLSIHLEAWLLIYVVMQATKSPDLIIFLWLSQRQRLFFLNEPFRWLDFGGIHAFSSAQSAQSLMSTVISLSSCFSTIGRLLTDWPSEHKSPRQLVSRYLVFDNWSKDIILVYRHLVYYHTLAYGTVIHPISVSANNNFHHFQRLLALWFHFINPASTDTILI